jgi:hypothetical protein
MDKLDHSTLVFRAVLKWLGADHKLRLACGVLLGLILNGGREAMAAYWANSPTALALSAFGTVSALALGIFLAFAPLFLWRSRIVSESYKATFDTVDEIIARSGLSAPQRRMVYWALLMKIQTEFSPERLLPIGKLAEKAVQEVIDGGSEGKNS